MTLADLIEFYELNGLSHDAPLHHRDLNYGGSVGSLSKDELTIVTAREVRKKYRSPSAHGDLHVDTRSRTYGMVLISEPVQTACD